MNKRITGFHTDAESHWVAELECGHGQHVRHDPPWMVREWVTTEAGRTERIGTELNCVRCDEAALAVARAVALEAKKAFAEAYESAGLSGLCDEGRIEAALGAIETLPLAEIAQKALENPIKPQT